MEQVKVSGRRETGVPTHTQPARLDLPCLATLSLPATAVLDRAAVTGKPVWAGFWKQSQHHKGQAAFQGSAEFQAPCLVQGLGDSQPPQEATFPGEGPEQPWGRRVMQAIRDPAGCQRTEVQEGILESSVIPYPMGGHSRNTGCQATSCPGPKAELMIS